ncbi:MAG TPA: MMPL family transporter, partial [Flavisolibacter sp.]|nr:MMPL family transporter [Flavisolibacter sp.]
MWKAVGEGVLRYRIFFLVLLVAVTIFMGWQASQVKLSYEFSKAIPTDNPKYIAYQNFKKQFGEDGNLLVIGVQTDQFFQQAFFNDYRKLQQDIKGVKSVEDILSIPTAVTLVRNEETETLQPVAIFPDTALSQKAIDSSAAVFMNLPFYKGLLYNPDHKAFMMGVRINREVLASPARTAVVNHIIQLVKQFEAKYSTTLHLSGLPLIRTMLANRIQQEMKWFTAMSLALSAIILLVFFRSLSAMLLSLGVVMIGVIWSFGTMQLMGYKITLLTALIPPLIVVIGIPNCIYFLNKYHTSYKENGNKRDALIQMVAKMGIVTLFCNIAAAIGFAVFALTSSEILKEFGAVAGINIMLLFFISLVLIPGVLSMLPVPKPGHMRYLNNAILQRWLGRLEHWSLNHRKAIYITTAVVLLFSIVGVFRLKSVGYIVDDLPKTDKIYTDLKFFENHFKGVMPLEILVDTKKKYGVSRNLGNLQRIDSLSQYLAAQPYIGKPLSVVEGLKFAKQAFFEGDSTNYSMPSEYDLPAMGQYLQMRNDSGQGNAFSKLVGSFMDENRQQARISVSMQDVGSARLPAILDSVQARADQLFDTAKYDVQLTGSSVTFVEGSQFIIDGLKESIFWAFLLIA